MEVKLLTWQIDFHKTGAERAGGRHPHNRLYPDLSELGPDERCTVAGMKIGGKPAYLYSEWNKKTAFAISSG